MLVVFMVGGNLVVVFVLLIGRVVISDPSLVTWLAGSAKLLCVSDKHQLEECEHKHTTFRKNDRFLFVFGILFLFYRSLMKINVTVF